MNDFPQVPHTKPQTSMSTASKSRVINEDPLLDLNEVAEVLGHISTRSVRRLIARGDLPKPIKILSKPRLYHSEVMAFLQLLKQKRDRLNRK